MHRLDIGAFRNAHKGETAILLGNGPTLASYDKKFFALLSAKGEETGTNVIGINRSYTQVWTKYHCFVASDMWNELADGLFKPEVVFTLEKFLRIPSRQKTIIEKMQVGICTMKMLENVWMLRKRFVPWLDKGTESSFGGIFAAQIAAWMGHKTMYLVGYDCHDLEGHHCCNQKTTVHRSNMLGYFSALSRWAQHENVKIYNCNADSAIKDFPFRDLPGRIAKH